MDYSKCCGKNRTNLRIFYNTMPFLSYGKVCFGRISGF
ncbi:hypothetical protein HCCG_01027 [Helicobacter cinaedi CCUG 18818 = ATCC BAA-847]|uniref:Uncharacterized protein n=1 Tax=Helicobacter cinaedi CCUG 18818 = ATCC BAA-847 TaxID=537971 RepID=A0ABN0BAA6_9HELI|nr:hypothetical protein HCCG_01027 [Helicobacter cinaedi CCUG 18818 = ATCC BAA-847]